MDVRDKVVRAGETGTPRNKSTSLLRVWTKRVHKLSDDIRDNVLKAVEGRHVVSPSRRVLRRQSGERHPICETSRYHR